VAVTSTSTSRRFRTSSEPSAAAAADGPPERSRRGVRLGLVALVVLAFFYGALAGPLF
jgi:hypothetical protein